MNLTGQNNHFAVVSDDMHHCKLALPDLEGASLTAITCTPAEGPWRRVVAQWELPQAIQQDEVAIRFTPAFDPDFWWAPHLSPEEGYCIAQHVFRAPALIACKGRHTLVIVPDLDLVADQQPLPWFLDYDATANHIWLGLSKTKVVDHVLYQKTPGLEIPAGQLRLGFYLCVYDAPGEASNPWSEVSHFFWERWGRPLLANGEPTRTPLDRYVEHTYNWAFNSYKDFVWQEFELDGNTVGSAQFIVNVSQSPNSPTPWFQREFLSIWNQAWFSSLRGASGVYRYARRADRPDLIEKAQLAKELALAAPVTNGIFPAVIRTDNETVTIGGAQVERPQSWDTGYWTNSNRCPVNFGITPDWYHVLDASYTCLNMLRWYEELEKDDRLIAYAMTYAERLLTLQDEQGFFPGWLDPETHEPGPVMNQTPETSMSVTFLLKLAEFTGDTRYRDAALRAMEAVLVEIVPVGRWEDYETYWSCCPWGRDTYVGKPIPRNAMYKQNNMSSFWTAEALLAAYRATEDSRYLAWGRRTLDELSMSQQAWQPPYIYVPALGGFGVMNCDAEWNDSRETLFAEIFLDYYTETGDPHLFERGICALKSGFTMMYCPENPKQKEQWEKAHPFFGPEDYGFTMENYGHDGVTSSEGVGIGVFTCFDWGNGAAAEAWNRIHDHYGDVFVSQKYKHAFVIDSGILEATSTGWTVNNPAGNARALRVVFSDGTQVTVEPGASVAIPK